MSVNVYTHLGYNKKKRRRKDTIKRRRKEKCSS
jgi:hypothetical protein